MAGNDANLVLPVQHAALDGGQRAHVQIQRHIRGLAAEQRNRLRDVRGRVAGRLVKHGHMQSAPHALVDFIHSAAKSVGRRKQGRGLRIDFLPFRRQRKSAPTTAAQGQAQPGFQILDVAAHGGGADVQFQFRRRHAAAIHHGAEHAQQAQVHVADLA